MRRAVWLVLLTAWGIGIGSVTLVRAQRSLPPNVAAADKGPAKIDVSSYPPEMQKAYQVFTKKCGACHTVARAINSDFVLEGEWEADVHDMAKKAGKLISADDAQQIYDFLVYDSKVRKADLYRQHQELAAANTPPVRVLEPMAPRSSATRSTVSPEMMAAFDKGPARVDVSAYPPDVQKDYQVFTKKCGLCHTPARALNSDLVLESEWEADINDMTARAGRLISADEAKQVFAFLVYDSKIRKADLYQQRQLAAAAKLPAEDVDK